MKVIKSGKATGNTVAGRVHGCFRSPCFAKERSRTAQFQPGQWCTMWQVWCSQSGSASVLAAGVQKHEWSNLVREHGSAGSGCFAGLRSTFLVDGKGSCIKMSDSIRLFHSCGNCFVSLWVGSRL